MNKINILIFISFSILYLLISIFANTNGVIFITGDGVGYYQLAKNIIGGNGFSRCDREPFLPDSIRTPIYPLFLAGIIYLFGQSFNIFIVIIIQCFLAALTMVIIKKMLDSLKVSYLNIFGVLFIGLSPMYISMILTYYTEILFLFTFSILIYLFLKLARLQIETTILKKIFMSGFIGFLLGILTLLKPMPQFLFLLFCGFFIIKKKYCLAVLIMLGFFFSVSPWIIRNYLVYDRIAISSSGFVNIYNSATRFLINDTDRDRYEKLVPLVPSTTTQHLGTAGIGYMDYIQADRMKKVSLLVLRDKWPKYLMHTIINLVDFPTTRGANLITKVFNIKYKEYRQISWKKKILKFEFLGILVGSGYELLHRYLFYLLAMLGIFHLFKAINNKQLKALYFSMLIISYYYIFLQSMIKLNDFELPRILLPATLGLSIFIPLGLKQLKFLRRVSVTNN